MGLLTLLSVFTPLLGRTEPEQHTPSSGNEISPEVAQASDLNPPIPTRLEDKETRDEELQTTVEKRGTSAESEITDVAEILMRKVETIVSQAKLTQRDVQILVLISEAKTNAEIEQMLNISGLNNQLSRGPYRKLKTHFELPPKTDSSPDEKIQRMNMVLFLVENGFRELSGIPLEDLPGRQIKKR